MLEIISCVGTPDAVNAAVQNGADAICITLGRPVIKPVEAVFDFDSFAAAARYCRVRGCRVLLDMSYLVPDGEMQKAAARALRAADMGADAILLSDPGLASVLRTVLPDTPLYASAAMGFATADGLKLAAACGFTRVLLPMGMPLEQIRTLAENSPVELDACVYGASCVAAAGQCYLSPLAGGGSANRGICSHPCVDDYSLGGRWDDHPLCLKDLCLLEQMPDLVQAGLRSVRIEGYDMQAEFTAEATRFFVRAARDRVFPSQPEFARFQNAFSSRGYTGLFTSGEADPDMFGADRSSPERDVYKYHAEVRRGYESGELRRVPVSFFAFIRRGEPSRFGIMDTEGHTAEVRGPVPRQDRAMSLSEDFVRDTLYRTSGTPYSCEGINCILEPGLSLTEAQLAAARRRLLSDLTARRREATPVRHGSYPAPPEAAAGTEAPGLIFQLSDARQMTPELATLGPLRVYLPLELLLEQPDASEMFLRGGSEICALLPRVVRPGNLPELEDMLRRARSLGVSEAVAGCWGAAASARRAGFLLRGDTGFNVFNSRSMGILGRAGFSSAAASFELSLKQIGAMAKPIDTEMVVYGRLPAMVTEPCLIKHSAGKCVCRSPNRMSDRRGGVFPIFPESGCRNTVYSDRKIYMGDKLAACAAAGLWGLRLIFTTESPRECVSVALHYMGQTRYRPNGLTRGLYFRGPDGGAG